MNNLQIQPLSGQGNITGVATAPTQTLNPQVQSTPVNQPAALSYIKNSPTQPDSTSQPAPLPVAAKSAMISMLTKAQAQYPGQEGMIMHAFLADNQSKYPTQMAQIQGWLGSSGKVNPKSALAVNNPMGLKDPATGQFEQFSDPQTGFQAGLSDLMGKISGNTRTGTSSQSTLLDLSKAWAGTGSNNVSAWADSVAKMLGVPVTTPIGQIDPTKLASAVARHETGYTGQTGTYDAATVLNGLIKDNQPQPNQNNGPLDMPGFEAAIPVGTPAGTAGLEETGTDLLNNIKSIPHMADFIMKGLATGVQNVKSIAQAATGNMQGAIQTQGAALNTPFGAIPTLGSSSVGQNLGTALQAGAAGVGLSETLPAIASNAITSGGISGGAQGLLSGLGNFMASGNRPDLKTSQGVSGALQAAGTGLLSGAATGAGAAAIQPAITGQTPTLDLLKNKTDQIVNDKVWQMVKDPDLEPNTNKNTMTGTVASVEPTTPHDQQLIAAAKPYVTDDAIQTKQNLQTGIALKSQELQNGLVGKGGTWSETTLQGVLNDTKVPLALKNTAEMTVVKNVNNYVMELAQDPNITRDASGSLALSKQFRQSISTEYGENIWNKDTPPAQYIKNVNQALNNLTATRLPDGALPDGTPFKSAMQQISLLSEARDNVEIPREGKQTSTNMLGKGLKVGKVIAKPVLQGVGLGEIAKHIP